jgi:hypothetical protein
MAGQNQWRDMVVRPGRLPLRRMSAVSDRTALGQRGPGLAEDISALPRRDVCDHPRLRHGLGSGIDAAPPAGGAQDCAASGGTETAVGVLLSRERTSATSAPSSCPRCRLPCDGASAPSPLRQGARRHQRCRLCLCLPRSRVAIGVSAASIASYRRRVISEPRDRAFVTYQSASAPQRRWNRRVGRGPTEADVERLRNVLGAAQSGGRVRADVRRAGPGT